RDERLEDVTVVEVVLGLIEDERVVRVAKDEREERRRHLALRELRHGLRDAVDEHGDLELVLEADRLEVVETRRVDEERDELGHLRLVAVEVSGEELAVARLDRLDELAGRDLLRDVARDLGLVAQLRALEEAVEERAVLLGARPLAERELDDALVARV